MDLINYNSPDAFSHRHLLSLQDYTRQDILHILATALHIKKEYKAGIRHDILRGKTLAMIFSKSSTRTRVSFEVGMMQLGGQAIVLNGNEIHLGKSESVGDTAKVLSRFVDGIMIRTFAQSDVEHLAEAGSIPIINGLTDDYHPCQALADILTAYEHLGTLEGLKLAFVGDGNNVSSSLAIICSKLGIDFSIASPQGYQLSPKIAAMVGRNIALSGSKFVMTTSPAEAVDQADIIYTDIWASMGQEAETALRMKAFQGYQVDRALLDMAKPTAIFMHCLPAHRGDEVTDEVMDCAQSVVFDEAENRLHAQKAVLALLLGEL